MSFFRKPTPLPVTQGGTGNVYNSYGYAIIGNGYSAYLELTPSTSGNVMTSNGTTWTSAPPASSGSGTVNSGTQYQLGYYATTGTAISGNSSIVTNVSNQLGIGVSPTARVGIPIPIYTSSTNLTEGMIRFQNPDVSADSCLQSYYVTSAGSDLYIGANSYINTSGNTVRFNTGLASSGINVRRDGTLSFWTGAASGNAVTRVNVGDTGNVTFGANIGLGGTTPTTSGTGITFPATQSASTNANTLDDYEEGTWTPVVTPDSGSLTSYSSSGVYTKIGNSVSVQIEIIFSVVGTASGGINFSGLPFTSKALSGRGAVFLVRENYFTGNASYQGYINNNNTIGGIYTLANGGVIWLTNYQYTSSFIYFTN